MTNLFNMYMYTSMYAEIIDMFGETICVYMSCMHIKTDILPLAGVHVCIYIYTGIAIG